MAEISDKALKNNYALNKLKLKATALNSSTQYSDESQFQTGATSYRHAMRNRDVDQIVDQAKGQADAFVRKQFDLAKQLLSAGNIKEAIISSASDCIPCRMPRLRLMVVFSHGGITYLQVNWSPILLKRSIILA